MPRIIGIDIPANKRLLISLTYIYGIGRVLSEEIISKLKLDPNMKAGKLTEADIGKINTVLSDDSLSDHINAIKADSEDRDFSLLAKSIRDSIEKNEPENALDRLHTFVVRYIRNLCDKHQITYDKDKPLHSFFGEYIKHLKNEHLVESIMTERIMKSSISILESFNKVRNNQSFAHDNEILNYHESLLIFKNISAIIEFLESVEKLFDTSEIYSHSDLNNTSTITRAGFANLMTEWKGWAKLKTEKAKVEEQETVFFCLRLLLYAVGSIMLIVPKLLYSTKVEE